MSIGPRNSRIDSMRGVSIILVLLHHFNIAYPMQDTPLAKLVGWTSLHAVFRNGNYAVTIFFVISGFLITSNAGRRWGGLRHVPVFTFYRLRAARIIPCTLLLLLVVNLLASFKIPIFGNHPETGGFIPFWIVDVASITFWMNVLIGRAGWLNYVLCVQWSLSIEEIFYLVFPILCVLLKRERLLIAAWSIFIILGPVWRATHQASEYGELYSYLSCFDGIAFGCCATILARHIRLPPWSPLPIQALVTVAMAWFYLQGWIGNTAVYGVTLMAFGTSILLVARAHDQTPPGNRKSGILAPLRTCGQLSYELYLFHLLVLAALRTIWPPGASSGASKLFLLCAYLTLSIILAMLVNRYYSAPLNRRLRATARLSSRMAEA